MATRKLLLALAAAALIAGCGGDDDPAEGGAVRLTEWLPAGGLTYTATDLAEFKEELDLPEDADPMSEDRLEAVGGEAFAVLLGTQSDFSGEELEALGPEDVTATAVYGSGGADATRVAAFATTADVGEIGSRLGDLGYRDDAGVLQRRASDPGFRLEDGIVFASDDPDALREIPDEPRDDPPLKLLSELDGDDVTVLAVDDMCFTEAGAAVEADGDAELGVLVPGGAEAERFEPDTGEVGEAEADGDVVVKPVLDPGSAGAHALFARFLPGYDCG